MNRNNFITGLLFVCGMVAGPVSAAPNFTATVSGQFASDGSPDNTTADFTFNNTFTSLSLMLTNTDTSVGHIASVLDGISFSLSGLPSNALSLTSLSNPNGTVDCMNTGCTYNSSPVSLATSGWTYSSGLLSAGSGSFKPYGIVNGNVTVTDGIPNGQHNPYLDGPATFVFSITNPTNTPLSLTSANLYFGTQPDIQTGIITTPVPEPGTFALSFAGLVLIGFIAYSRKNYSSNMFMAAA